MHAYLNTATKLVRNLSKPLLRCFDNLETKPAKQEEQIKQLREALESKIYTELLKIYPDHEFAFPGLLIKNDRDIVWHINVLSGENNFRHRIPHFATVITIYEKQKPQHALIFDPILQELFTATKGAQTSLNNTALRVSTIKELETALIGTNFNFTQVENLRRTGCPALELAYVAAGRLDAFVGKEVNNHDINAGTLLIKVAGGLFGDWRGDNKQEENGELIAANPKLFKELIQLLHGKSNASDAVEEL